MIKQHNNWRCFPSIRSLNHLHKLSSLRSWTILRQNQHKTKLTLHFRLQSIAIDLSKQNQGWSFWFRAAAWHCCPGRLVTGNAIISIINLSAFATWFLDWLTFCLWYVLTSSPLLSKKTSNESIERQAICACK